jgi:hypothetical protein
MMGWVTTSAAPTGAHAKVLAKRQASALTRMNVDG